MRYEPRRFAMHAAGLTLAAACSIIVPVPAAAQSFISAGPHLGLDASVPGVPLTAGAGVTWHRPPVPWLAVRGRIDVGLTTTDIDEESNDSLAFRAFTFELDGVLRPDRSAQAGPPIGAIDPFLFGGLGMRAARDTLNDSKLSPVGSYGGGLSYWMSDLFRIDAEARYRATLAGRADLAPEFDDGWSFTIGARFHFGTRWEGSSPVAVAPAVDTVFINGASDGAEAEGPDFRFEEDNDLHARARASWPPPEDATAARTLDIAEDFLGVPYVWGGADPSGFDCSGFVQYVYEEMGITLPRPSRLMAQSGVELPAVIDSLRPGDLMFFSQNGDRVTHVGIYAGANMLLHATGSGDGVSYDDLTTPRGNWFAERFVWGGRVIGVPIRATRAAPVPLTPEMWDPVVDGAPPPGTARAEPGGGSR